jgi:Flp pilus assembly protein CpaB
VSNTTFTTRVSGKMSSRGWAIALGIGAVVLAAILLVVYLDRYRARVSGRNAPTPVLVAKQTIRAGTPGTIVASGGMYVPSTLPRKDVVVGAISDPQYLSGRAAAVDIFPGHQITAADFAATAGTSVGSQITGKQRAISVSVDNIHGSLAQVKPGDSVDIYIELGARNGQQLIKLFQADVKVLALPNQGGDAIVLRMNSKDVPKFMFMADNTQMYWAVRPIAGAKPTVRASATVDSVLR